MSRTSKRTAIAMPTMAEDKVITAAAKADPDAPPLTTAQLNAMVPIKAVRGRPRSVNSKQLVSVRYSREVLEYFRSTGDGWQARMDGVLLKYVARQSKAGKRQA